MALASARPQLRKGWWYTEPGDLPPLMRRYLRDREWQTSVQEDEQEDDDFYNGHRVAYSEPELLPQDEHSQNPYDEGYCSSGGVAKV